MGAWYGQGALRRDRDTRAGCRVSDMMFGTEESRTRSDLERHKHVRNHGW